MRTKSQKGVTDYHQIFFFQWAGSGHSFDCSKLMVCVPFAWFHTNGAGKLVGRAPDCWLKDCEFESRQKRWENFLIQSQLCVLTLIQCLFHPLVTPVACKRPRSFCKKCRWQVTLKHAYTLTQQSQIGLSMPLCRHSVGTYKETSSHSTHQETLGHSHPSSLSHCGLILA